MKLIYNCMQIREFTYATVVRALLVRGVSDQIVIMCCSPEQTGKKPLTEHFRQLIY